MKEKLYCFLTFAIVIIITMLFIFTAASEGAELKAPPLKGNLCFEIIRLLMTPRGLLLALLPGFIIYGVFWTTNHCCDDIVALEKKMDAAKSEKEFEYYKDQIRKKSFLTKNSKR